LRKLANDAKQEKSNSNKSKLWNEVYKPELLKLVGWDSELKELQNPTVFEIASKKICEYLQY